MPATTEETEFYHELMAYTLAHRDPAFIHQHVVDAWAAQQADECTKSIALVFALVGLYLHVEKGYTGKQVQRAHMLMAKRGKGWARPSLAQDRGSIGVRDVLAADPGRLRDSTIHDWCVSVWNAWHDSRNQVVELAKSQLGVE